MKLRLPDYIILIVEDLDRALEFYTGVLGLNLKHRAEAFAQLLTTIRRKVPEALEILPNPVFVARWKILKLLIAMQDADLTRTKERQRVLNEDIIPATT